MIFILWSPLMVAFSTADLPSSINTVEKVLVWGSTVMQHLHPTLTAIESTGNAERVISAAPFFITATDPAVWRYISRTSIPLNSNWQRGTGKIWTFASDISSSAIPTEFKS
jgi:hypothetical protein